MTKDSEVNEELVRQIKDAFRGINKPQSGEIADADPLGEGQLIESIFLGKNWEECSLGTLLRDEDALWAFNPIAFHYFMPAYLTAIINYPSETCRLHFAFIGQFLYKKNTMTEDMFHRRMSLFNKKQTYLILMVVQFLVDSDWVDAAKEEIGNLKKSLARLTNEE